MSYDYSKSLEENLIENRKLLQKVKESNERSRQMVDEWRKMIENLLAKYPWLKP